MTTVDQLVDDIFYEISKIDDKSPSWEHGRVRARIVSQITSFVDLAIQDEYDAGYDDGCEKANRECDDAHS